jgi:hypothetical protein
MRFLERAITDPLERFFDKVLIFLPNLLSFVVILLIGIVIAWILKKICVRVLRAINLDKMCENAGTSSVLAKGGLADPPSVLLARVIYWIIILVFVIIALRALDLPAIAQFLDRLLLYIPQVLAAAFIVVIGYLMGVFFGRAALIASVNAGIRTAGLVGRFVKFTVFILACSMALEQLGIGKDTVLVAFGVVFGGAVLAFALAFGLGGSNAAKNFLEKRMKGEDDDNIRHL